MSILINRKLQQLNEIIIISLIGLAPWNSQSIFCLLIMHFLQMLNFLKKNCHVIPCVIIQQWDMIW